MQAWADCSCRAVSLVRGDGDPGQTRRRERAIADTRDGRGQAHARDTLVI